jgi:hypothetical protein
MTKLNLPEGRKPMNKKETTMKKTLLVTAALLLSACVPDAQMASSNLSKAADMFEIERRIVFYNGITDSYMLTIEGRCSIRADGRDKQLEVTCKIGPEAFKKHFLGLSDNVTYFVEQLDVADVSVYHHRVVFKPQSLLFDADVNVDTRELMKDRY